MKKAMIAKIKTVQEGDPLRLSVTTGEHDQLLELTNGTVLKRGDKTVDRKELRPGQDILITGHRSAQIWFPARIDLVDTVHGSINEVMEIFPLRLLVQIKTGPMYIQLEEETLFLGAEGSMDAGNLKVGQSIHVFGVPSGNLFMAKGIEVESKT